MFTGDEFGEGADVISKTLQQEKIKASFFLTGKFYKNPAFKKSIQQLVSAGQYMGAHSDQHLLYCDWLNRDSLLVSKKQFDNDLDANYKAMSRFGIKKTNAKYFLPPYEWYNDSISKWTLEKGLQLVNYTPGTLSHADYTNANDNNYRSSEQILQSILNYEASHSSGLNGFILLMHIGAGPGRTDKFYSKLPELIKHLKQKNYQLLRIDELLK